MKKINKIISALAELNYKTVILNSLKDTVVLFYNNAEKIIFGISIDKKLSNIDVGTLCAVNEGTILGCSYRLSDTEDLKNNITKILIAIKEDVETDEKTPYLDRNMKIKQKFSDVQIAIRQFAESNNYHLFD